MKSLGVFSFVVVGVLCAATAGAATLYVGLNRSAPDYTTVQAAVNAASSGDTILIDPGTYVGAQATAIIGAVSFSDWTDRTLDNFTIKGNGGRPVLDLSDTIDPASGWWADAAAPGHKGIFLIRPGTVNLTIDNIEFMHGGQRPGDTDGNGAGIRVDDVANGGTITLRNCVIRDSQNGILDGNQNGHSHNWDIQNCVFHDCGNPHVTSGTHNLYMQPGNAGSITFKYNWSYNCHMGYCFKTRSPKNYIMYNRLGDEMNLAMDPIPYTPATQQGNPLDIPNGGLTYVIGNILQQVPNSADGRLCKYGEEGITAGYSTQFYGVYNTILGRRDATVTGFEFTGNSATPAYVANNLLVHDGAGNLVNGSIVNNSAMINSNLVLYVHQGMNPPAVHRFMYDANAYDCGDAPGAGNHGTANTYDTWNVLNVRPVDPNTFPFGANCSNTTSKMPLTGYQTLISPGINPLMPGSNPLALPATGTDGTSLTPTGQFGPDTITAIHTIPVTNARANATDAIGALSFAVPQVSNHQPVGTITSTLPQYIYEGWTVNLTATATDEDAGQTLTYQWSQTAGQGQTLTAPTALTTSFTVAAKSLTSRANEALTFRFVATDNGPGNLSSTPVTASVTCYMCGDIDHDNAVILADLKLLVASWNTTPTSGNWNQAADLDNSQSVNLGDLKLLVANWNRSL